MEEGKTVKKSYAKQLKEGPVFRLFWQPAFMAWELEGSGKSFGSNWKTIGMFPERKYALMLMKAITLKAREKKVGKPKKDFWDLAADRHRKEEENLEIMR